MDNKIFDEEYRVITRKICADLNIVGNDEFSARVSEVAALLPDKMLEFVVSYNPEVHSIYFWSPVWLDTCRKEIIEREMLIE